jgi:ABC-type spermidine/putrescine transport system permease subunit I
MSFFSEKVKAFKEMKEKTKKTFNEANEVLQISIVLQTITAACAVTCTIILIGQCFASLLNDGKK